MDYYSKLLMLLPKEDLENQITEKIKEFHGYLSRDAAITLLSKKYKIYKKEIKYININKISQGLTGINIKAKMIAIKPTKEYFSGKKSREIILKDSTGSTSLFLWEKDIQLLNKIRLNDELELLNVYEKNGHLNLGYRGKLSLSKKSKFTQISSLSEGKAFNLLVVVSSIKGQISSNNQQSFSFLISDGSSEKEVVVLEDLDRVSSLEKGDEVLLENVRFKNNTVRVYSTSRLFSRRPKNLLTGKLQSLNLKGEKLETNISGKTLLLEGENVYKFLSLKKDSNISLKTIIGLKKPSYMGKKIFIKFEDKDKNMISTVSVLTGDLNV